MELLVPRSWDSWFLSLEPLVTIARNCWLPEGETHAFQLGNQRLPLQGTASSQRLEHMVANVAPEVTIVRTCRFLKVGTHGYQPENQRLPLQGTAGCQGLELLVRQPWNQWLPLQVTSGSQRLELMVRNLGTMGYPCKEPPVPRGWNSWFGIALCCFLSR